MNKIYFWHRLQTFFVSTLILLIGIAFERYFEMIGFGFLILFFLYIGRRERKLYFKKVKDGHPSVAQTTEVINNFMDSVQNIEDMDIGITLKHCNICGKDYSYGTTVCDQKDIPFHHVNDIPEKDNPYAYWWYQTNGYPPPNVIKAPNSREFSIKAFQEVGKIYYMQHDNYAWDSGIVSPPEWYVERKIINLNAIINTE